MGNDNWPEIGEFVVCTVKNVTDFGAYVELEEFGGREGFIHISEIKAGWVKYVRDYVREGQKIVCKVLNVDPSRGHDDYLMSLALCVEAVRTYKVRRARG